MILVDSSIWIDHLRDNDPLLAELLEDGRVLMHPFVIGEIALGRIRQREFILRRMNRLHRAVLAREFEMIEFIERHALFGEGIGYVDAHLLASARLTPQALLWTRDSRLHAAAERLSVAADI